MAGTELLAYKPADKKELLVKTERCNWCGACCKNIKYPEKFKFPVINGNCAYLHIYTDGKTDCQLGVERPFSCCYGDPTLSNWSNFKDCCIKYEKKLVDAG